MKAIEKRRDHRYETAAQFAQDIQRHLNEEPVMAGPPSAMYLISKLARRHKVAFFTSVVVAASLAIGFAAVAWGFVNANYYRGIAEARLAPGSAHTKLVSP
jgi:hypothetical protein